MKRYFIILLFSFLSINLYSQDIENININGTYIYDKKGNFLSPEDLPSVASYSMENCKK